MQGQNIYYQDIFKGGVTGAGFSVCLGSGSGTIPVYIEPGSTIKKAFLFSYRIGDLTPSFTCTFNGIPVQFSESNRISNILNNGGVSWAPNFSVHTIDVTNIVSTAITSYSIDIPPPDTPITCLNCRYNSVFLVILYENPVLGITSSTILINGLDNAAINLHSAQLLNPINNLQPVAFSLYSDRLGCFFICDSAALQLNGFSIGIIGQQGDSINLGWGCGVKGHFYYQDSLLFGLDDDSPDSTMNLSDGLADIKSYLSNNTTSFNFSNTNYTPTWPFPLFLTFQLAYTTPCHTFTASVGYPDTLICIGDSVQLSAYGGLKYLWKPNFGLRCDTCANTIAKPDSSTLYTCTIYNNDSCTKVLPVKVNIYNNVGVEPIGDEIKIILYPNPAENNITIKLSSNTELEYTVTSIQGQELKGGTLYSKETEIDVSELSPGFYFIKINGGGYKKSLRFIKQ